MKTITIPDWLYKTILISKNQYSFERGATLNDIGISTYKELTKGKETDKERKKLLEWLGSGDYTPEIPMGFWVQIHLESCVEFGTTRKYETGEQYLRGALLYCRSIRDTSSKNYRILKEAFKRVKQSSR